MSHFSGTAHGTLGPTAKAMAVRDAGSTAVSTATAPIEHTLFLALRISLAPSLSRLYFRIHGLLQRLLSSLKRFLDVCRIPRSCLIKKAKESLYRGVAAALVNFLLFSYLKSTSTRYVSLLVIQIERPQRRYSTRP